MMRVEDGATGMPATYSEYDDDRPPVQPEVWQYGPAGGLAGIRGWRWGVGSGSRSTPADRFSP